MAHRIFTTSFAAVYPMYVQKAERKGRTQAEVDAVIQWLTGYDAKGLAAQRKAQNDFATFFAEAPAMNRNTSLIAGARSAPRHVSAKMRLHQQQAVSGQQVPDASKVRVMLLQVSPVPVSVRPTAC